MVANGVRCVKTLDVPRVLESEKSLDCLTTNVGTSIPPAGVVKVNWICRYPPGAIAYCDPLPSLRRWITCLLESTDDVQCDANALLVETWTGAHVQLFSRSTSAEPKLWLLSAAFFTCKYNV